MQHNSRRARLRARRSLSTLAVGTLAGGLVLTLAGCSTDTATEPAPDAKEAATASSAPVGEADVVFATSMIPHHRQALRMAAMAQRRDLSPAAARLATAIREAQGPEIEQMTRWLDAWGEPAPTPGTQDMAGMSAMPGMMDASRLVRLRDSGSDRAFERAWLRMMIEHHQGAVEMARTEVAEGEAPQVVGLAERVIDAQTAEIRTMRELLR